MGTWFWLNIPLCAVIFSAMVGIPMWMVIKRPDTGYEIRKAAARLEAGARGEPGRDRPLAGRRMTPGGWRPWPTKLGC
jgi:hypothetical protein